MKKKERGEPPAPSPGLHSPGGKPSRPWLRFWGPLGIAWAADGAAGELLGPGLEGQGGPVFEPNSPTTPPSNLWSVYIYHPGRKREHESNIGSRVAAIQSSHKKGDVCFNSILLKIGNAREAIADMNSLRSDKLEK